MRASSIVVILIATVVGCGQKEPVDPIDRVAVRESSNPFFFNGLHGIIRLPESASPEQLISETHKYDPYRLGTVNKILESKKIHISYQGFTNEPPYGNYTAVLTDTDTGMKVVLFQYSREPESTNDMASGWIYEIYAQ